MTFTWKTPPWQRHEDCTHMAVTLVHNGGGNIATSATSLRGNDATEALADFLMGDPGGRAAASMPGLVAVVVRRGIDVMWMAQPPSKSAPRTRASGPSPSTAWTRPT